MDPQRLHELFLQESREILENLNQSLLTLERAPGDQSILREIYRLTHTLKGVAASAGYPRTADLSHSLESALDRAVKGNLTLTRDLIALFFKAVDQLEQMTMGGEQDQRVIDETEALLEEIAQVSRGQPVPTAAPHGDVAPTQAHARAAAIPHRATTVRIDVKRLDALIDLAGELLILNSRLRALGLALESPPLNNAIDQLQRISNSLQHEILQARMLPIGSFLERFARTVRDLAREAGKEVELAITGQEIELDRTIMDEISEPLIHLLRNSISHGIESPEVRERLGKSKMGRISLSASREADWVVLEVADDGRGINLEEIRQAAIQKGFLRSDQASTASGQELLDLLFLPGFSTAAAVTEVSGRGIGLNIVKVRIEALRGSVELKSTSNQGTRFLLRFPPTMAIVEVLLVRVRKEFFAIPMVDVAEVLEVDRAKFNNSNIMVSRGKTITLVDLAQSLGLTNGKAPAEGPAYVLTSSFSSGNNGLMVDEVTGRQPIVIKSVGLILNQVAPFSGATILGDGRVVLILDLHTLLADKVARPIAEGGIRHGAGSTALIAPAAIKKKR